MQRWASAESLSVGYVVGFVVKAVAGGPLIGLLWTGLLVTWLSFTFDDAIAETTMSLCAAYSLWIVTDEILSVSGMLALVFFGTALGAYGAPAALADHTAPTFAAGRSQQCRTLTH